MRSAAVRFSALILLLAALAGAARGDDDDREHGHREREAIRGAVERGEIKPLAEVLGMVAAGLQGEVVGVEVERKDGAWVYELRVIEREGRMLEVYVDAATAKIIKTKVK